MDGKPTEMPVSVTGGLKIWKRSSHIYLQTDFGLSVAFNGHHSAGSQCTISKADDVISLMCHSTLS